MNSKIVFGLLSIFAVVAVVGGVAFANFSSAASNTGNTFGAGTLTLKIRDAAEALSTPYFTVENSSNLKPGDTRTQTIKLSNSGSLKIGSVKLTGLVVTPLTSGTDLSLGDVLTLKLYKGTYDADNPTTNLIVGADRKLTAAGWNTQDLGITINPRGPNSEIPPVVVDGSQDIVAVLTFDSTAESEYQGKSVTFGFTFQATQE